MPRCPASRSCEHRTTRYDRFVSGDVAALSPQALRGMALFAGLGCRECHRDPSFSAAGVAMPAGVFKPFPTLAGEPLARRLHFTKDRGAAGTTGPGLRRVPSLRRAV
ncbi:MAG: hypothetical protein KGM17_01045 [Sphingomonadales bacterium]|nr:hypothetical protein [Sphingomonadales bacterium]